VIGIVVGHRTSVNLWFVMVVVWAVACHVGRPAPVTARFALGRVDVPVAEPGLEDAIRSGMARSLARAGALSPAGGIGVDVTVIRATTRPIAVTDGVRVHTARLEIEVRLDGVPVRRTVLTDERSFTASVPDQAASARAAAFSTLSQDLAEDAVSWMRYGPGKGQLTP